MKKLALFLLLLSCSSQDSPGIPDFAGWIKGPAPDGRIEDYFGVAVADQDSITTRYFAREVVHAATDTGSAEGKLSHPHVRKLLQSLDSAYRQQDQERITAFRDSIISYITRFPAHLTVRRVIVPDSLIIMP